jgi:predicted amidohydrolase
MYFDTSFGVRFGMMICFDIMFETPTEQVVEHGNTELRVQHLVGQFVRNFVVIDRD